LRTLFGGKMLGNRIKIASKEIGGIDALAAVTGIPRTTLYGYVNNKNEPKSSVLADIAKATNVTLDWLVFGKEPMRLDGLKQPSTLEVQPNLSSSSINEMLFQLVGKMVSRTYKEENVNLPADAILSEVAKRYNEVMSRIKNPTDSHEVKLALDLVEYQVRQGLQTAAQNPGTGKHSA
jgi:transcriptional regulator with XRE-family HTH domain